MCCSFFFFFLLFRFNSSGPEYIIWLLRKGTTIYCSFIISTVLHNTRHIVVTQSYLTLCNPMDWLYSPWNSPGPNTGVGSLSLLHGIFLTQGSNPGLPHCRRILYQLSHKGSPRILEWVAYSFSSRSSQPRNQIRLSFIASGFFTNWAVRGAQGYSKFSININWLV